MAISAYYCKGNLLLLSSHHLLSSIFALSARRSLRKSSRRDQPASRTRLSSLSFFDCHSLKKIKRGSKCGQVYFILHYSHQKTQRVFFGPGSSEKKCTQSFCIREASWPRRKERSAYTSKANNFVPPSVAEL